MSIMAAQLILIQPNTMKTELSIENTELAHNMTTKTEYKTKITKSMGIQQKQHIVVKWKKMRHGFQNTLQIII